MSSFQGVPATSRLTIILTLPHFYPCRIKGPIVKIIDNLI